MARNGYTKFNINHVLLKFQGPSEAMADSIALQLEARTKVKITSNGQIDTGFMRNATYTVSRRTSSYGRSWITGEYANRKGQNVKRKIAPEVVLPGDVMAAVAVGASYAIWQEEKKPFLYPATVETAKDSGVRATAEKVFRDNLNG